MNPEEPFTILERVDGAYNPYYEEPYDYSKNDYYDRSAHGNCKSLIAEDLLAIARCDESSGPIYGYAKQGSKELLMMAPWDIASGGANKTIAPQRSKWNLNRGIQFKLPRTMVDNTRHNHNELVHDRLMFDEKEKKFKQDNPQYVIYIKDFNEDTFIDNDRWKEIIKKYGKEFKLSKNTPIQERLDALITISEKTGEPLEELVHDDKYRQSIKAAAQYNIPLLIVDREKVVEHQNNKMNAKIEEFKENTDVNELKKMIPSLITSFQNNSNSIRFASKKIQKKCFTRDQRVYMLQIIKKKIDEIESLNPENGLMLRGVYEEALIAERNKLVTNVGIDLQKSNAGPEWDIVLPKEIKEELDEIDRKRDEEFSRKQVPKLIKEISKTNYYDENKYHSIEHIQKVMIFADKLGTAHQMPAEAKTILLAAAAFHDSGRGRKNDGDDAHGVASAMQVQKYFEEHPDNPFGITSSNLRIIQAAIEFHEVSEKNKGEAKEKYNEIAKKYGIDSNNRNAVVWGGRSMNERQLLFEVSRDLKDADALDRLRFAHRGRLNPDFLRSNEAKDLFDFANVTNAKFASIVLEKIYHATPEQLRGHRKVSSLEYFREMEQAKNPEYIEPHISVDTLLEEVYGYDHIVYDLESEKTIAENRDNVSFARRTMDMCMYDDLTPTDVESFVLQLKKTMNHMREKNNDEELR